MKPLTKKQVLTGLRISGAIIIIILAITFFVNNSKHKANSVDSFETIKDK